MNDLAHAGGSREYTVNADPRGMRASTPMEYREPAPAYEPPFWASIIADLNRRRDFFRRGANGEWPCGYAPEHLAFLAQIDKQLTALIREAEAKRAKAMKRGAK